MVPALLAEAWRGVWTHRLRTGLTMLGVGWGLFAEMLMLSLGIGLQRTMHAEFARTGPELITVYPGEYQKALLGPPKLAHVRMQPADVSWIRAHATEVKAVAPEYRIGFDFVRSAERTVEADIYGLHPRVAPIRSLHARWGRFLTHGDMDEHRRVCVLGTNVAARLALNGPHALGTRVVIRGVPLTIVGVLAAHGEQMGYNHSMDDDQLYMPISTAERYFLGPDADYWAIHLTPRHVERYQATIDEVRAIMGARQRYNASVERTAFYSTIFEDMQVIYYMTLGLKLFLGVAGAVTVLVGGVGVRNIMSVSIAERTNEIGLRKALGGAPREIFWQFFLEALLMTGVAAGLAFAAGLGLIALCAQFTMPRFVPAPMLSPGLALFLLALTVGVGVFAGTRPALRAARMQPALALRHT